MAIFVDQSHLDQAIDELRAAGFRPGQIEVMPGGNEFSDDPVDSQRLIVNVQADDRFDEAHEILVRFEAHVSHEHFS